jgi:hypothetical protein
MFIRSLFGDVDDQGRQLVRRESKRELPVAREVFWHRPFSSRGGLPHEQEAARWLSTV